MSAATALTNRRSEPAGAIVEAIVLRDRGDRRRRVVAETELQVPDELPAHRLVRQAELGIDGGPDALDLAEPLGVRREIPVGRNDGVKGVDEPFVDVMPAAAVVAAGAGAVRLVTGGHQRQPRLSRNV
jgi:hypothetical protein